MRAPPRAGPTRRALVRCGGAAECVERLRAALVSEGPQPAAGARLRRRPRSEAPCGSRILDTRARWITLRSHIRSHEGAPSDEDGDHDDHQPDASPSVVGADPLNLAAHRGDQPAQGEPAHGGSPRTRGRDVRRLRMGRPVCQSRCDPRDRRCRDRGATRRWAAAHTGTGGRVRRANDAGLRRSVAAVPPSVRDRRFSGA